MLENLVSEWLCLRSSEGGFPIYIESLSERSGLDHENENGFQGGKATERNFPNLGPVRTALVQSHYGLAGADHDFLHLELHFFINFNNSMGNHRTSSHSHLLTTEAVKLQVHVVEQFTQIT